MAEQRSTKEPQPQTAVEAEEATKVFAPRIAAKLADEALGAQAMAEIEAEQRRLDERRASLAGVLGQRAATDNASPNNTTPSQAAGKRGRA